MNMRPKTEKTSVLPKNIPDSKKLIKGGPKLKNKKFKRVTNNDDIIENKVPVINGVEKVRKRKGETIPNVISEKKPRDEENTPHKEVIEVAAKKTIKPPVVKVTKPKETKTKATSSRVPKVTKKRQKVILPVPGLPTISGVLFVIGSNEVGQLGFCVDDVLGKKRPVEQPFPDPLTDIAAGGMHSVCLTSRGEVYTFGCNDEGALGRFTNDEDFLEYTPRKVEIPDVVVQVSAGDSHSAALTEDGQVYLWGNFRNGEGSIGLITPYEKSIYPVRILENIKVVKIASGADHFVSLSEDGIVYTCGNGESGQLGRVSERSSKGNTRKGPGEMLQPKPVPLKASDKPISNIWTGSYATYLKSKTKEILAFGLNNYAQLGIPSQRNADGVDERIVRYQPTPVPSFLSENDWQFISGGQHHTLALDSEGLVYSLGRKEYGILGLGKNCGEKDSPTLVSTLSDKKVVQISSGNVVSLALTDNGSVYSWGFGENHQLGHGNDQDCYVPKLIEGNFQQSWFAFRISGGGQHTLILANRKGTTNKDK